MGDKPINEKTIFEIACSIESAEARSAYLIQVCGDNPALLERVTTLLRMRDEEPSFLESPPADILGGKGQPLAPTIDQPAIEQPGSMIGPYKLIEEIGEGGMGSVFMALQKEPVRRKVALKVIKAGMDTKEVVSRFEAERQALALMDHPNIAKVLDAASTDSGRPYFVMELVRGYSLLDYCDRKRMPTRERLGQFIQVCQAVQHAHQKGVIHRDLKPSNVMVTLHDGVPVPKVIDFGIAKAISGNLTDSTLVTNYGQAIGTPLYMSPEQAEMSGLDIDTRSDVYSLGVLLYELLTGTTPFERERMKEVSYDEFRRIIREEEPPRPSTRLSTLDAALDTVADKHHTDPRTLSNQVSGELDWIVMKSLEKDRTRRYESANELAKDVQRYLDDEPVEACPPTTAYRLGKFYRRNKVALAFFGAIALTFFVGAAVATGQAVRATAAEGEAKEQKELAEQRLTQADEQRQCAEANYTKAREAVKQMLTRVADEELAAIPEMVEMRMQLMQDARLFYDELIKLNPDDAQAYFERADVRQALAEPTEEVTADYERAIELDPQNANFERWFSAFLFWTAHDCSRALRHAQRAVELAPGETTYLGWLSSIYDSQGEYDKSLEIHEKAIAVAADSAAVYAARSNTFRSMGNLEAALADARKAIELDPAEIRGWLRLSDVLVKMKDYDEALVAMDRAIEIAGPKRGNHYLYATRCDIHDRLGNSPLALEDITLAIELFPKGRLYATRARLLLGQGDTEAATRDLKLAIELFPEDSVGYDTRAQIHKEQGRLEEALADWTASIQRDPTRSHILKRRGWLYFELGRYDEALIDIAKAVELNPEDLTNLTWAAPSQVAACPDEPFRLGLLELADKSIELNHEAARAYAARGWILVAYGQEEKALADLKTAFAKLPKDDELGRLGLSETCYELGNLCGQLAHRQETIPYLVKMAELQPENPIHWYRAALAQLGTGQLDSYRETCRGMLEQFQNTEDPADGYWTAWTCLLAAEAVDDYASVVRLAERAVEAEPESGHYVNTLGAIVYRAGRFEEAVKRLTEANNLIEAPDTKSTSSPAYTWYFLAMAHHKLGHEGEAKKWLDRATEWSDKVIHEDEEGTTTPAWNRRLTLKLLHVEAEGMIGKDKK